MEKIQWAPPPEHNSTDIKWICTPKSCAECDHYNQKQKRCGVKECPYPARRSGANIRRKHNSLRGGETFCGKR